jgi:hypothetical protein
LTTAVEAAVDVEAIREDKTVSVVVDVLDMAVCVAEVPVAEVPVVEVPAPPPPQPVMSVARDTISMLCLILLSLYIWNVLFFINIL